MANRGSRELSIDNGESSTNKKRKLDITIINQKDDHGNTRLHHAVEREDCTVEKVRRLIKEGADVSVENNENEIPLDIAIKTMKWEIAKVLGKKGVDDAEQTCREIRKETKNYHSTTASEVVELTEDKRKIALTNEKIESCLNFLKNLNGQESESEKLSYKQALHFIYFLETFALEGTGNFKVKSEMMIHFSQFYTKDDRTMISDARKHLLKRGATKVGLDDVSNLIHCDFHSDFRKFFKKLQRYVQHVQSKIETTSYNDQTELTSELKHGLKFNLKNEESMEEDDVSASEALNLSTLILPVKTKRKMGKDISDVKSFVKEEYNKLIKKSFGQEELGPKDLFDFLVNFYPKFDTNKKWSFRELGDLRNKLMHEFHKYGYIKFRKMLVGIKHELFKYGFAEEVHKIVSNIRTDEEPKAIRKSFERQLKQFENDFETDFAEPPTSHDEGKGFQGHEFSKSILPEEVSNFKELVSRYLMFKTLTDNFEKNEDDDEESIAEKKDPESKRMKKLIGSDRLEMFEEFDRLERIRADSALTEEFSEKKRKFKKKLVSEYGVKDDHFDGMYKNFEECKDGKYAGEDEIKSITRILTYLKKLLKDNPKLSNQVIISLYDIFVTRKEIFTDVEKQDLLKNVATDQDLEFIMKELKGLPGDKFVKVSKRDKLHFITFGRVIKEMLDLFNNAHSTYRVVFEIKDIFNDDKILKYLVRGETEDVNIVEQYYKFLFKFESRSADLHRREIFEEIIFLRKIWINHDEEEEAFSKYNYETEKDNVRRKLKEKYGLPDNDLENFDEVCDRYIKRDAELTYDEKNQVNGLEDWIQVFRTKLPPKLSNREIAALYGELITGKGKIDFEKNPKLLNNMDNEGKKKMKLSKTLKDWYDGEFIRDKDGALTERRLKVIGHILEVFGEKLQLKSHNYMYIKKMLNINFTAPYIVRLITEVKSDEIIEKKDLIKLIEILLSDEDGSYMKHLSDLLRVRSGKLNLYREVCDQIRIKESFNIDKMLPILNEPEHREGILAALFEGINSEGKNKSRGRTVPLTKRVLKLLNSVVLEIIHDNDMSEADKILKNGHLKQLCEYLIQNEEIKYNDPIHVEYKLNSAKVNNTLGKTDEEKTKIKKEVVADLEKIPEIREDDSNYYLYLLVLSRKGFTLKLLDQNADALFVYKDLHERVVKFVLDESDSNSDNTYSTCRRIENSEKYRDLLESSKESGLYLDILVVVGSIAINLRRSAKIAKDENGLKEALKISQGLYRYRKEEYGSEHKDTLQTIRRIATTYCNIATRSGDEAVALQHRQRAAVEFNRVLKIQKRKYNVHHPVIKKLVEKLKQNVRKIGKMNETELIELRKSA